MKNMEWIKNNYIAHRGLHNQKYPENTIEAFYNATKNGYDIEFDLQLTKDNKIVVVHDNNLFRLTGLKKKVSKSTYDEIKILTLNSTSSTIPMFEELLSSLPKETNLMIELKKSRKNRKLVQLFLETIKKYDFQYVVQSFDPRIVNLIRKYAPSIPRGYILKNQQTKCRILNAFGKLLPIRKIIRPDYYVYKIEDLPNKRMDKYKSQGVPILSYTATSQNDLDFVTNRYHNAVFEGFSPKNKEEA